MRAALLAISGACLPLALAPIGWWPIALLSVAVLKGLVDQRPEGGHRASCAEVYGKFLFFGLGLYASGASWIFISIHQYGQASAVLSALLTVLFVIALAAIFALPMMLYGAVQPKGRWPQLLLFSAAWVLGEWFRGWFLTGFPWLYLGYGFIDSWLAGWAPVGGALAVSGMVALTACVIGLLPTAKRYPRQMAASAGIVAVLWVLGGVLHTAVWTQRANIEPLRTALIQPDLPILEKWQPDFLPATLAEMRAIAVANRTQDLLVWPESAIPALAHQVEPFLTELGHFANTAGSAVILGLPRRSLEGKYFNTVIGLGRATGSYEKRRLVPFGEYVPLESWLRGAIAFFDLPMSAFSSGTPNQRGISLNGNGIASAICYEIAYGAQVAIDARDAAFLLTVSIDTWFGDSLGPHQHLQIARMRALENGKPLARGTNDGITAFIDHRGRIVDQLPRFKADILYGEIAPRTGTTPYGYWRDWPVLIIATIAIFLGLTLHRRTQPAALE